MPKGRRGPWQERGVSLLSLEKFLTLLGIAAFLPFILRMYRTSGTLDPVNVDRAFTRYRNGSFVASETKVLFSDMRVDRFAPSKFLEAGAPYVAVYICRDSLGQHWLWKLYRPTEPDPVLTRLTPQEAESMLQRKDGLLKELCPKQRPSAPIAEEPGKSKRFGRWDG